MTSDSRSLRDEPGKVISARVPSRTREHTCVHRVLRTPDQEQRLALPQIVTQHGLLLLRDRAKRVGNFHVVPERATVSVNEQVRTLLPRVVRRVRASVRAPVRVAEVTALAFARHARQQPAKGRARPPAAAARVAACTGLCFVDVLAADAGSVVNLDLNVAIFEAGRGGGVRVLREDRDDGGSGLQAALTVGERDSLHALHARLGREQ